MHNPNTKIMQDMVEVTETPEYNVTFHCAFCGTDEVRKCPVDIKEKTLPSCPKCSVNTKGKVKGRKVNFASPTRANDGFFALGRLELNKLYTIKKIKQWQHGTDLILEETGRCEFNIYNFVPENYDVGLRWILAARIYFLLNKNPSLANKSQLLLIRERVRNNTVTPDDEKLINELEPEILIEFVDKSNKAMADVAERHFK